MMRTSLQIDISRALGEDVMAYIARRRLPLNWYSYESIALHIWRHTRIHVHGDTLRKWAHNEQESERWRRDVQD